mgnify:CR=1 FL=1
MDKAHTEPPRSWREGLIECAWRDYENYEDSLLVGEQKITVGEALTTLFEGDFEQQEWAIRALLRSAKYLPGQFMCAPVLEKFFFDARGRRLRHEILGDLEATEKRVQETKDGVTDEIAKA